MTMKKYKECNKKERKPIYSNIKKVLTSFILTLVLFAGTSSDINAIRLLLNDNNLQKNYTVYDDGTMNPIFIIEEENMFEKFSIKDTVNK